jgi:site-specific DNA-adenine methylase
MTVERPILRYFGGKWQLRHWITDQFPRHRFYAEAFAGAASVLLSKEPAPGGEIINDLNRDVINLFRVMQNAEQAAELQRRLDWTPYASAELSRAMEPCSEPIGQAWRIQIMIIAIDPGTEQSAVVAWDGKTDRHSSNPTEQRPAFWNSVRQFHRI